MAETGESGYHWRTEEAASRWERERERIDAARAQPFEQLLERLPRDTDLPLTFLDVGAGDGRVASLVLDRYPHATGLLVDFSRPMIQRGRERLRRYAGHYDYVIWDMNQGQWPEALRGPFDAAVSSAAIHHLENPRKAWLCERLFSSLKPQGIFANYDLFRDPTATFEAHEVHDRTCASLHEAVGYLAGAGFEDIEIAARMARPSNKGEQALLSAIRPA
jgi:trans-aconitate methyltransferase